MNKVLKGILCVFILISVAGCGKKSPVISLCDDIEPIVNEHMDNKSTYNEFINQLNTQYNKHCNDKSITENQNICSSMSLMINNHKKYENNEVDCNQFGEGSYKQVCESNRQMHYDLINKKTEVEFLKTLCNRERNQ